MRRLSTPLFAIAAFGMVGVATPALAQQADRWAQHGKECDNTAFRAPDEVELGVIAHCVRLWEAYQNPTQVRGAYKDRVVQAMTRLYQYGPDVDSRIARGALVRLDVTDLPPRGQAAAQKPAPRPAAERRAAPPRPAFEAPEPSKREISTAERHFKRGFAHYRKDAHDRALSEYLKMIDVAPGYPKGHYNTACIYALLGDQDNAIKYLQNVADLAAVDRPGAMDSLRLARRDSDFDGMRETNVDFKRITGYSNILVQNTIGDLGEENVDNLVRSLRRLGHENYTLQPGQRARRHPIVWYAEHARPMAYTITRLLNHPNTQTVLFSVEELQGYDVVVAWGDEIKEKEAPRTYVSDPRDAEKTLNDLERREREMLARPNEAMDDVEDVLGKPEEVGDGVQRRVDRVERSVDRVEGTIDRAKGLFGR